MRQTKRWLIVMAMSSSIASQAASRENVPPPDYHLPSKLPVRDMIGVTVRRPSEADLVAIKNAGVEIVRLDLSWSATERSKGKYDFSSYMSAARTMGRLKITPIYVLAYGNSLYEPLVPTLRYRDARLRPAAPANPAAVEAFSLWAVAAARAFQNTKPIFEIWNEPDVKHWWPPIPSARDYGNLASATCRRLHDVGLGTKVIGPGIAQPITKSGDKSQFMQELARQSNLTCLDAISTHNYALAGKSLPDGMHILKTKEILSSSNLKNKPLWSTEWGWSAVDGNLDFQGSYLIKTFIISISNGIRLNIWYQWKDWFTDADEKLNHYGLVSSTGAPKPAFFALRHMLNSIGDLHFKCAFSPSSEAFGAVFDLTSKRPILVVWGNHTSARIWGGAGAKGEHIGEDFVGKRLTIEGASFGDDPVYLNINSGDAERICKSNM